MAPSTRTPVPTAPRLSAILFAGLAGGAFELAWVGLWTTLTQQSGTAVAREISTAVYAPLGQASHAALIGIAIHFALSMALATLFVGLAWRPLARRLGGLGVFAGACLALTGVWAFNFLVLLPWLDPAFVALLPLPVSAISKFGFGAVMGYCLMSADRRAPIATA
jgi:hypothetical protein